MEYFYKSDYTLTSEMGAMVTHAKLFGMAVKYQVDGLRTLTATTFEAAADTMEPNRQVDDDFITSISVVYQSTPRNVVALRNVVAFTAHNIFTPMRMNDRGKEALINIPGFAYDILKYSSLACMQREHPHTTVRMLRCEACKQRAPCCTKCSEGEHFRCIFCGSHATPAA